MTPILGIMTDVDPPEKTPKGSNADYIADAVAEVMQDQAKKAVVREEALAPQDRPVSAVPWIALGLLTLASLYLWFGSPGFLEPAAPPPLPPALEEAGLRMEVHLQALRVRHYLEEEGRLPNSLAEAGDPFSAVEYERLGRRDYRLWLQGSSGVIQATAADSLATFLGDAPDIIRGGGT